ncbi:Uncharacterised protein [uncultured Flavonifractor sp.]|nr:Uncharacterised protein [Flavonifractor plautii]SCJ21579.1 Uncharacterised protein [uncultured Flavonifractor sp.]
MRRERARRQRPEGDDQRDQMNRLPGTGRWTDWLLQSTEETV